MKKVLVLLSLSLITAGFMATPAFAAPSSAPLAHCNDDVYIPDAECKALVDLYNSTNGDSWTNGYNGDTDGWTDDADPCTWYNVTCAGIAPNQHVTEIILSNNNLSGPLPSSLGDLKFLRKLRLSLNTLNGSIPPTLGNLSRLMSLQFGGNSLNGNIPPELGNLSTLENLSLDRNNFSGEIPTELGNLTNLLTLRLYENNLMGRIPASIGNLTNAEYIEFENNNLSGNIPWTFNNLTSIIELLLDNNPNLTGAIPPGFANLSNLTDLYYGGDSLATQTKLCASNDLAYQAWESTISIGSSNGLTCDPIFYNGFESGDTTAWSSTVGKDIPKDDFNAAALCKLCVKKKSALIDQFGLKVRVPNRKPHYVVDTSPGGVASYNARFKIKVKKTLKMANLNKIRILQGRMGTKQAFFVEIRKKGTKFQIRAGIRKNGGKTAKTAWILLPKKATTIEVNWTAGSGTGAVELFINDVSKRLITGINNDTLVVDSIRFGTTKKLKAAYVISGSYKLDAFASDSSTHIGLP